MRRILALTMAGLLILLLMPASASAGSTKVDVCHLEEETGILEPIRVSEKAVARHLDHGDVLVGAGVDEFCNPLQRVLHNSFGPNDEWNRNGTRQITTPDFGNPPADHDLAEGFLVPTGEQFRLTSIEVAMRHRAGPNELDVYLLADRSRDIPNRLPYEPDVTTVLESWHLSNQVPASPQYGSLIKIDSVSQPLLEGGTRYWVMMSVQEPNSWMSWQSSWPDHTGPAFSAERDSSNGFQWQVYDFSGEGGDLTLRITATPTT